MRYVFVVLAVVFYSVTASANNKEWRSYKLDSLLTVDFPDDVTIIDTLVKGLNSKYFYSVNDNTAYLVIKMNLDDDVNNQVFCELPNDIESLKEAYVFVIEGMARQSQLKLSDVSEVLIDSFVAYKAAFYDDNGVIRSSVMVVLLNKQIYSICTASNQKLNEDDIKRFINSVAVNKEADISQFRGISRASELAYLLGEYSFRIFIVIGIVIYIIVWRRRIKARNRD
ncbi:MAG: hypothetical protein N4A72_08955 [Bacteroidales bacterium]|jgi:hypothetical protein|nr:hypothetical protein [Bacteroidales bacterium]